MGQEARHPILERLTGVLQARGESESARCLETALSFLDRQNDEGIRSLALRYCREYGLDPQWILHGQAQNDAAGRLSEWTPVFAMASIHPRTGRWRLAEVERIALAPSLLSPTRFVTRMDSRALEPRIRLGAYLIVDTAQEFVPATSADPADASPTEEASAFAVDLHGEGLVVRLARYVSALNKLELLALERKAPTLVVPSDDPDCRVVGRVVWVAQDL